MRNPFILSQLLVSYETFVLLSLENSDLEYLPKSTSWIGHSLNALIGNLPYLFFSKSDNVSDASHQQTGKIKSG